MKRNRAFRLEDCMVSPEVTIREAIRKIDQAGKETVIVCEGKKMVGIVTDSDVRRGILRGVDLDASITEVTNYNFIYAWYDEDRRSVYLRMKRDYIKQMPILNENREVVDMFFLGDIERQTKKNETPVLIMAGGLGTRLRPLTDMAPKPMLPVGGRPLLETIIRQFEKCGFTNILLSVNYQKDIIKNYFQDGSMFNVSIRYIEEEKRMGTAGAIRLAKQYLHAPFFVINGDILTNVNFEKFMEFHCKEKVELTVATSTYRVQIPYGVVDTNENRVKGLREKPNVDFFINAGMYCMNPEVIDVIPEEQYFDMTDLLDILFLKERQVASFPIHEYWMDIGQVIDYEKANEDYAYQFLK